MRRSKTIYWDQILEKIKTQPWASSLVNVMRQDFEDQIHRGPKDPPLEESEWGHHYFCKTCGIRLDFNITKPHIHTCPKCHKDYSGWPYDGAWRKIMHSVIVSNMERAAVLAHIPQADNKYKNYIHDTILFYANNYDKYPEHGKYAGIGKVYPQALSEAIFVIAIERILRMSADLNIFNESEYDAIGKLFFTPALHLIKPQINQINNIHAWMQASIAACANFLDDRDILKDTIYGRYGWLNQLEKGTFKEGIWYEISPTYHYYTLNALLSLAWIALENDIDLFENPTLKKMASNYVPLVYPNGKFPSYNDGWFESNIFDSCTVYEELSRFDHSFGSLLSWIYKNASPRPYSYLHSLFNNATKETGYARASIPALIYGPVSLPEPEEPVRKSFIYEDTGIAVLQNDKIRVSLKFTGNGGGHDHNDKNSIEVYANDELLSYDPGTSGYGISFTREWSRTSISHNMVCINNLLQKNSRATVLDYNDQSVCVQAQDAYRGVSLKRKISLKDDGFIDIYAVNCRVNSQIDWIFHCRGRIETRLPLKICKPFTEDNGYDQLFDLRQTVYDKEFNMSFISERQKLSIHFEGEENTRVIIGKCYGADKTDILSFIMLRRYGKDTQFSQQTSICCFDK